MNATANTQQESNKPKRFTIVLEEADRDRLAALGAPYKLSQAQTTAALLDIVDATNEAFIEAAKKRQSNRSGRKGNKTAILKELRELDEDQLRELMELARTMKDAEGAE